MIETENRFWKRRAPGAALGHQTPDLEIGRTRFPALHQRNRKGGYLTRARIGVCAEAALCFSQQGKRFQTLPKPSELRAMPMRFEQKKPRPCEKAVGEGIKKMSTNKEGKGK